MRATLQSIFLIGYAAYRRVFWLPDYIDKAAWSIMNCRTAVLGGHALSLKLQQHGPTGMSRGSF